MVSRTAIRKEKCTEGQWRVISLNERSIEARPINSCDEAEFSSAQKETRDSPHKGPEKPLLVSSTTQGWKQRKGAYFAKRTDGVGTLVVEMMPPDNWCSSQARQKDDSVNGRTRFTARALLIGENPDTNRAFNCALQKCNRLVKLLLQRLHEKRTNCGYNLREADLVLEIELAPRRKWTMGIVLETYPSENGLARKSKD